MNKWPSGSDDSHAVRNRNCVKLIWTEIAWCIVTILFASGIINRSKTN